MCIFKTPPPPKPAPPPTPAPPAPEKAPDAIEDAVGSNAMALKAKAQGAKAVLGRAASGLQVNKKNKKGSSSGLKIGGTV